MKKIAIGLGVLVLLVLAAPFLVPTSVLRDRLVAGVRDATGRELTIAGSMRLSLVPRLAVTAQDVRFANAAWAGTPEMARMKALDVELRLVPLLSGRIEVSRLVLEGPEIALEVGKDGVGNWVMSRPEGKASPATGAAKPAEGGKGAPLALRFEDVRLEGGKIGYRDARSGVSHTLERIALRSAFLGMEAPFRLEGEVAWKGELVKLAIATPALAPLLAGKEGTIDLKIDSAPLTLAVAGTLAGLPPSRVEGTIDLATPSLRKLAAWAGTPINAPGDGLGPLSIKGRFHEEGTMVSFSQASLALDAIRATGELTVHTGKTRPSIGGKLAVGTLDLNPYLPPEKPAEKPAPGKPAGGKPAGAAPAAGAADGWSEEPLDFAGLTVVDALLELKAEKIIHRRMQIDQPQLRVQLINGKLEAGLGSIGLYGGMGKADLLLDSAANPPSLALDVKLIGSDMEKLLGATIGFERLSGRGSIALAVTARGTSQRAMIATLAGRGNLDLADGQVKGVNLIDLARSALPGGGGGGGGGGGTAFGELLGTFTIEEGVLYNEDLVLKAGAVGATGAGKVSLIGRSIEYRAVASLAGAVKIPVNITGPWSHIAYRPDGADALKGVVPNAPALLRGLFPRP